MHMSPLSIGIIQQVSVKLHNNFRFTLQQHMLTHGGKLCRCPEVGCFFIARKMSELHEHFTTHSSEKNFACDLCSYRGKTKKQLKV